MKCFYHNDLDGECSAAIVKKDFTSFTDDRWSMTKEDFTSIGYNQDFPFDTIHKNEKVIIVDYSLQKDGEFKKLKNITPDIIWIDHHKTAIEKHKSLNLPGIRRVGTAGCALTWEYFSEDKQTPRAVALIADYDVWTFEFGNETRWFQSGVRINNTGPCEPIWGKLLDKDYLCKKEVEDGEIIDKYKGNNSRELIKGISFFTDFEGYRAVCCNQAQTNSQLFDSVNDEKYDIMMPFSYDGKQWTVSIYTMKNDIDVSDIAKKYGGGGHKQAAGFQCKTLPFGVKT